MSTDAAARLRMAFEMAEMGARMVEAKYRREHPDATDEAVADHIARWWGDRPGAPHGDAAGRPVPVTRLA